MGSFRLQRGRNERGDTQAKQHNLHVIEHVPTTCVFVLGTDSILHTLVTAPPIPRATLFGNQIRRSEFNTMVSPESEQLINSESESDSHAMRVAAVADLKSMLGVLYSRFRLRSRPVFVFPGMLHCKFEYFIIIPETFTSRVIPYDAITKLQT